MFYEVYHIKKEFKRLMRFFAKFNERYSATYEIFNEREKG